MSSVLRVNIQDVYRVIESDYVPAFNPFVEYLESLPEWHQGDHDYIADLATTVKIKGEQEHIESPEADSSLFPLHFHPKKPILHSSLFVLHFHPKKPIFHSSLFPIPLRSGLSAW